MRNQEIRIKKPEMTKEIPEREGQLYPHAKYSCTPHLSQYLKGVDFPAKKQDIVNAAKKNGASAETMYFVNQIAEKTYILPNDIDKEFSLTIQE